MIKFTNTRIGYNSKVLIEIQNMKLEAGKLYVLVGRNGSGKSTLLRTLVNQGALIDGDILFNGASSVTLNSSEVSKMVSLVQTKFPSIEYLNVREYISLGRSPYTNALGRLSQEDKTKVDKAISLLGIEHISQKFTSEISDGERQLTAIAKAIAQETKIILLDEPTAFLDYTNKQAVFEILIKIAQEMNKCVVLSSHDIDLSLEYDCEFLIRPNNSTEVKLGTSNFSKEQILNIAF